MYGLTRIRYRFTTAHTHHMECEIIHELYFIATKVRVLLLVYQISRVFF
jgi:hypothetical protein